MVFQAKNAHTSKRFSAASNACATCSEYAVPDRQIHCKSPCAAQTTKGVIGAEISCTNNTFAFSASQQEDYEK
jgi:hypothetical protein